MKEPETTVELYVSDRANHLEKRGQEIISNTAQTTPVEFSLSGLEPGPHQGFVRIMGSDPLPCDDARSFTIDVEAPSKVLLLGEKADDTLFLREALSPTAATGVSQSEFSCDVRLYSDLSNLKLSDYAAVFLVNPPPLTNAAWDTLANYAEAGGGVGISLGRNAQAGRNEQWRRTATAAG